MYLQKLPPACGFRRSELVGLNVEDVEFTTDGLIITLQRSKTDQEGQGRKIGIPFGGSPLTCPVRALRAWLDAAQLTEGPVFRSSPSSQEVHLVDWTRLKLLLRSLSSVRVCYFSSEGW